MAINFIVFLFSTLGYFLFLIRVIGLSPYVVPLVWISFVNTTIYIFAISNYLFLGVQFTILIGVVIGIYALLRTYRKLHNDKKDLVISSIWLIPIAIYYCAIPNDFLFLLWDEVGGWARSQKLIFNTNALLNSNSPFSLRSYPPGQQIFQYFITKSTYWSEKNLLIAQNIYIFAALFSIGSLFKSSLWACIVYFTIVPFIYFFNFDFNTLYSDPLIAAVFVGCLAIAIRSGIRRSDVWVLSICLSSFILLKDICLVFTVLVMIVYTINLKHKLINDYDIKIKNIYSNFIKDIIICIVTISLVILSWRWYVSLIGTSKVEVIHLTLDVFMQDDYRQRAGATITKFIYEILKPGFFIGEYKNIKINLSLFSLILLIIGISLLVIFFSAKDKKINVFLILLGIAAGAVGYLSLLLWLYLTYFTEYEGTRLASFDRYSMTYILAWFIIVYVWLMSVIEIRFKRIYLIFIPLFFTLFVLIFIPVKFYSDIVKTPLDPLSLEKRKATQNLSDLVRKYIQPDEKVYFLAQNTNGFERHLFDYAMLPYPPNDCWSVGKKYGDGDVWTCDKPLGLLTKDYSYLAIYSADQRFWDENAELFDSEGIGKVRGVYKKITTPDNKFKFKLVNE